VKPKDAGKPDLAETYLQDTKPINIDLDVVSSNPDGKANQMEKQKTYIGNKT